MFSVDGRAYINQSGLGRLGAECQLRCARGEADCLLGELLSVDKDAQRAIRSTVGNQAHADAETLTLVHHRRPRDTVDQHFRAATTRQRNDIDFNPARRESTRLGDGITARFLAVGEQHHARSIAARQDIACQAQPSSQIGRIRSRDCRR